jgi:hypothetical protein
LAEIWPNKENEMASHNKNDNDGVLGEFLVDQLPASIRAASKVLTELQYPVPDKKSLREQLKEVQDDEESMQLILATLVAVDFGLDTPQSALEKFQARVQGLLVAWGKPLESRHPETIPDEFRRLPRIPRPDFGGEECGRQAEELYNFLVDNGVHPFEAGISARWRANFCREYMPGNLGTDYCADMARRAFAYWFVLEGRDAGWSEALARVVLSTCRHSGWPFP